MGNCDLSPICFVVDCCIAAKLIDIAQTVLQLLTLKIDETNRASSLGPLHPINLNTEMPNFEAFTHHECKSSALSSSADNDHRPGGPLGGVSRHDFTPELLQVDKK